jgi:hypothetical protein
LELQVNVPVTAVAVLLLPLLSAQELSLVALHGLKELAVYHAFNV